MTECEQMFFEPEKMLSKESPRRIPLGPNMGGGAKELDPPSNPKLLGLKEKVHLLKQGSLRRKIPVKKAQNLLSPLGSKEPESFPSSPTFSNVADPYDKDPIDYSKEINKKKTPSLQMFSVRPRTILVATLLVAVLSIYYYYWHSPSTLPPSRLTLFEREFSLMQTKYPNQTKKFWKTIFKSLEPMLMTDEPESPSTIFLVVPENPYELGLCLAQHLAEILNKLMAPGYREFHSKSAYVDSTKMSMNNAKEQREKIDKKIREIVKDGSRTVIVSGLEMFNPKAVTVFQSYCNNISAIFDNIVIIFILNVENQLSLYRDEEIYAHLFELWGELESDKSNALMAGIAGNMAIMKRLNHFIC